MEIVFRDYLTGADQENPDWPVKMTFLESVEIAVKLGAELWFA